MIEVIKKTEKLDIMVVSAHPDDAEIGVGGTIAKLSSEHKNSIGIIDLTDGEPTPFTLNRDERIEEAKKSGEILGISVREILDLPNRKLFDGFEARIQLAKRIRQYQPKILIGHYGMTPHDSPDHYQAQLITEGAIFYARLSKWEEYFDLPVYRVRNLFYFATLRENQILENTGLSKIVMNIEEYFEIKKKALLSYESQFRADPKNPGIIPWIETMGRYFGKQIDKIYGEPLFIPNNKAFEVSNLNYWL